MDAYSTYYRSTTEKIAIATILSIEAGAHVDFELDGIEYGQMLALVRKAVANLYCHLGRDPRSGDPSRYGYIIARILCDEVLRQRGFDPYAFDWINGDFVEELRKYGDRYPDLRYLDSAMGMPFSSDYDWMSNAELR